MSANAFIGGILCVWRKLLVACRWRYYIYRVEKIASARQVRFALHGAPSQPASLAHTHHRFTATGILLCCAACVRVCACARICRPTCVICVCVSERKHTAGKNAVTLFTFAFHRGAGYLTEKPAPPENHKSVSEYVCGCRENGARARYRIADAIGWGVFSMFDCMSFMYRVVEFSYATE